MISLTIGASSHQRVGAQPAVCRAYTPETIHLTLDHEPVGWPPPCVRKDGGGRERGREEGGREGGELTAVYTGSHG